MALEHKLQECATNMKLSPIEVRKIIRKIVGNEHILALVKLQEEDDEKKKLEQEETRSFSESPTKLTRAKVRELNKVDPMLNLVQPLIESEQHEVEPELTALTKGHFHSDEEDEEYEPKEEDLLVSFLFCIYFFYFKSISSSSSQMTIPIAPSRTWIPIQEPP